MALADDILNHVNGDGPGVVFTAKDLCDLGTRAALDQALARLSRSGQIRRIDRGLYDLPRIHPRIGPLWPSADTVARALARQTGSHLKVSGAFAANALGLSSQVPASALYLTDGPSRQVHVDKLAVVLRHASRVDMLLPDTLAGIVLTALRYLGRDGVSSGVLSHLSSTLGEVDKASLVEVRRALPAWLGSAVAQIASA